MYNRILKRPMFKRGGPSYSHQGTGITSGLDTPRRGLVQHSGGYAGKTLEEINIEKEQIFEPKPYENINDIIKSFGVYAAPYKDDGTAMTTGEMGYEQAKMIDKIRTERKEKQDLAKLSGLESEEAALIKAGDREHELAKIKSTQEGNMAIAKYEGDIQLKIAEIAKQNTATGRRLQSNDEILQQELEAAARISNPTASARAAEAAKAKHKKNKEDIISGSNVTDQALKIAAGMVGGNNMKTAEEIAADIILIIRILQGQLKAKGGRVGYQMGTPNTGAAPVQEVQATENIMTPTADITATETVTEGQQASVQMPYEQFRASIPAEVSDEIVQLIYYNQDAFADFAQITTQADVYAFNNKYGVSLVLPMDTETT